MRQVKKQISVSFYQNYSNFSLCEQPANDINPIVETITSGVDQRHCSTTLLSIIPLAGTTVLPVTKNFRKPYCLGLCIGGTIDKTLLVGITHLKYDQED